MHISGSPSHVGNLNCHVTKETVHIPCSLQTKVGSVEVFTLAEVSIIDMHHVGQSRCLKTKLNLFLNFLFSDVCLF